MKLLLPKEVYGIRGGLLEYDRNLVKLRENILLAYANTPDRNLVEVDPYFRTRAVAGGNDICHVKPVDITPYVGNYPCVMNRIFCYALGKWKGLTQWPLYYTGVMVDGVTSTYIDLYTSRDSTYSIARNNWYLHMHQWKLTGSSSPYMYLGELVVHWYVDERRNLYFTKVSSSGLRTSKDEIRNWVESVALKTFHDNEPPGYDFMLLYSEAFIQRFNFELWLTQAYYKGKTLSFPSLDSAAAANHLILDENDLVFDGISDKPFAAYHLNALRQAAYLDALDHVPQLNENSLSNILEIVFFLKALIIDHRVEIPKGWQSLWLSYRYSYTTTKLDTEEAINFFRRTVDTTFLEKGFSCYGVAHDTVSGVNITAKCRLDMKQKELQYLNQIITGLYRYGLSPSFYVIWDMIPYSFIVDWFIPIGDILNGYDKTHMYDREYEFSNIWFSVSYDFLYENTKFHAYTRWRADSVPEYQGYYTLENKGTASSKVVGFRILDVASLLFR